MSAAERATPVRHGEVLRLPARLDATNVGTLWREYASRPLATIDLAEVKVLDSSGVALVLALRERGVERGAVPVLRDVPARFTQLCAAHRVDSLRVGA
jgi:ABC-type transporter Mla MlaB component